MIESGIAFITTVNHFVSRRLRVWATSSAMLFSLTIVLASCGGGSSGAGPVPAPIPAPTASLTATPAAIIAGQTITLAWASTNADQGTVDNGVGIVGLNGSTVLTPTATITYTYTAKGPSGTATASAKVTVNPVNSFDGMTQSDGALGEDVDPNGAVGTKQFMEYVNTSYQAYDKITGKAVWPSARQIETLWPSGSNCNPPTTHPAIQLDVVIIFDRLASRWVVGAKTSNPNPSIGYFFCIAVSSTDDLSSASLTWTSYSTPKPLDPILGTNGIHTYFPDWPKLSTWSDATGQQSAYYATMDLQDIDNGNAEVGAVVCAFDRTDLLNNPGNIKPESCIPVSNPLNPVLWSNGIFLGHSLIPADVDGTTVPPAGRDEFMVSIENPINDGVTLASSTLNLWEFHVDWTAATPLTVTAQSPISLSVSDYTPGCYLYVPNNPAITNCVVEPNPTGQQIVDSVGDRLMPRFAYRNFGSYESFLISHTVQTGPGASGTNPSAFQTGIQWYELRGSGTPSVHQSGTINPDASLFRFLPSIAQDKNGNAAVGYSISNVFTNPGIDFSYWSLPQATTPTEVTIINGTGEEVSPGNGVGKWGSYSSMTVDPIDDCTFWYVNEYFVLDNTWRTRIANFKIPGCQ